MIRKRVVKSVNCKKSEKKCKKVKFFIDKVVLEMYIVTRRWETGEILSPEGMLLMEWLLLQLKEQIELEIGSIMLCD